MTADPTAPPDVQTVDGVAYRVTNDRACTADEEFYVRLDEDTIRQSVPRLNDALARLLTLTTALAGGTLALLKDDVCTGWGRVLAAACFFASLVAAAVGTVPFQRGGLDGPADFAAAWDAARRHKRRFLAVSLGAVAAGLLAALAGATARVVAG